MAKTVHQAGVCIACGGKHNRDHAAWRCRGCSDALRPVRRKAINAVRVAILAGKLSPAKQCVCVDCGATARHYDHRDYSKPLDVAPVCHKCNQQRGPAIPIAA